MINYKSNTEEQIKISRENIRKEFSHGHLKDNVIDFTKIRFNGKDVEYLFYLYDKYFFQGQLKLNLGKTICFSVSSRMTSAGGKTIYRRTSEGTEYEIRISLVILDNLCLTSGERRVSGIIVSNPIEAMQIIIEHELCHVVEFYNHGISNCKGKRFKEMSSEIFGHQGIYHDIPTRNSLSLNRRKPSICIGDKVKFQYKNINYKGRVSNITKRATVMVLDKKGIYKDKEGNRYNKWYVPIVHLSRDGGV